MSLTQLRSDGSTWLYQMPVDGSAPFWQERGVNPGAIAIAGEGAYLYQLHGDGSIWQSMGPPWVWTQLDNNPGTIAIAAVGGDLCQLRGDGSIWQYTGTPFDWTQIDSNPGTRAIFGENP